MKPFSFEGESEREKEEIEKIERAEGKQGEEDQGGIKVLEEGGSKSETFTGENSKVHASKGAFTL